jgi:hypothetical protein
LELTDESVSYILNNGKMERPTYAKNGGPIDVKVVDPLNVADGYFELRFRDYDASDLNGADTASWVIYRYASEGGTLLDSIRSEMTISANNEQLIPQWGVSVQIHQELYYGPAGNASSKVTDMISSSISFADSSKQWLTFVSDNDAFFPTNWIRSGIYSPDTDPSSSSYECTPGTAGYLDPCSYRDELGVDDDKHFTSILGGGIAPHRLTGYQSDYMPMAYYNLATPGSSRANASISFLPSIDLVITSDKSKWTRCPVIETGRDVALNVGGCEPGALRKSQSVNKEGQPDGTGTGMGWFPGYAIDLETGARLYLAFGENSFLGTDKGADMLWNPSDRLVNDLGIPVMGGVQPIYVFSHDQAKVNAFSNGFDLPAYIPSEAEGTGNFLYQKMLEVESGNTASKRQVYGSLSWVAYPLMKEGQRILSTDVSIKLRINKEYKNYTCSNLNQGRPMYGWSMSTERTITGSETALKDVLKLINVVPNPYNAFSEYENNKLDNRVKITNLPERCTISIYSVNGKLIKQIKKDSPVTYQDWTLTNHANIPVASGVYLIHVEIPGIGERILKSFIAMRTVDLQNM